MAEHEGPSGLTGPADSVTTRNGRGMAAFMARHRRPTRFLRRPSVALPLLWLVLVMVGAAFAPLISPHDPNVQDLLHPDAGPGTRHLLGTDDLGRDVASRLIYGARLSMQVPFETVSIALAIALVIGLIAGFWQGWIDYVLMRVTDAGLAFPPLVLALAVVAILGSSANDVALAIAAVIAPGFARFIRGQALAVKQESFIEASSAIGSAPLRIMVTRILPNVMTGLIVQIAIALGGTLLAESGLAFLGLGPPPPASSWGSMLREAYDNSLLTHPWSLVPSGVAIALTVLAFNTLGDAIRDNLTTTNTTAKPSVPARARNRRGLTMVSRPQVPVAPAAPGAPALLEVRDLTIEFDGEHGPLRITDRVSFDVRPGRMVGLVGESGCGKTVSSLAILRLLPTPPARIVGGSIRFEGRDLLDADFAEMRHIRGCGISMVFQDPLASLNPALTVGSQLVEAVRLHEKVSRKAGRDRALRLLESVHIPDPGRRLSAYPHQLSGGMRQRVMIAMALACYPKLLIADEPTTALDVTVQAQIVELLLELRETDDLAVLFVTHDLALISELSDEIVVMYAGQVVEQAPTADLFSRPAHPYTAALLAAQPGVRSPGPSALLAGHVPPAGHHPDGCRFHPRCPYREEACQIGSMELSDVGPSRSSRCRRHGELDLSGLGEPPAVLHHADLAGQRDEP